MTGLHVAPLPEDAPRACMTLAEAAKVLAGLDARGATYRACTRKDGGPWLGWYEAHWFEPSMGEIWRQACNVDHQRDAALALAFKARVDRETPDQAAAAAEMKRRCDAARAPKRSGVAA